MTGIMANSAAMMAVLANTGKLHLLFLVHRLDAYKLTLHTHRFPHSTAKQAPPSLTKKSIVDFLPIDHTEVAEALEGGQN